jgi:hypothetical protein
VLRLQTGSRGSVLLDALLDQVVPHPLKPDVAALEAVGLRE